jgi:hypothetical protein
MKKIFVLLVSLVLLAGCTSKRIIVAPIGSSVKVSAVIIDDIHLEAGDTVILYESTSRLRVDYIIANDFILREPWVKYDSTRGVFGREYHKAVVVEN